jgi:hypothetical protein
LHRGGGRLTLGKIVISTPCGELEIIVYQSTSTWRIITFPVSEDADAVFGGLVYILS